MSNARFTPQQAKRIGFCVQDFEAHGRNRGIADDFQRREGVPGFKLAIASLTAVNQTINATTWVQTLTFPDGSTANGYNTVEWNGTNSGAIQGSPGAFGINVATTGQLTGTSCYVKPPGPQGPMLVFYDNRNRWNFTLPNWAG
jgi:hypothetical protein